MKKYLVISLTILCSCVADDYENNRNVRFPQKHNSLYEDNRYIKPSESMQAGVPKNTLEQHMLRHYNNSVISGAAYFPQNLAEFEEVGTASWYGGSFHNKPTASGEIYDSLAMTAAHPTLPLPSMVRITNLRNGRTVVVRVNDRGPFAKERVIDVSEKAAENLGFKDHGTTLVYIQLLRDEPDEMLEKLRIRN